MCAQTDATENDTTKLGKACGESYKSFRANPLGQLGKAGGASLRYCAGAWIGASVGASVGAVTSVTIVNNTGNPALLNVAYSAPIVCAIIGAGMGIRSAHKSKYIWSRTNQAMQNFINGFRDGNRG